MTDYEKTKKQLLDELDWQKQRSDSLHQVSKGLAGAHGTGEVLDLIVNEAARLLGANAAYMRLLERDVLVARAATKSATAFLAELAAARPTNEVEVGVSLTGHVMATKTPLVIEDGANQDVVSKDTSHIRQKYEMHGTAAVPLLANGRSVGVLVVVDKRKRRFNDDEVSLLAAFADQASCAFEKARLLQNAEREKERSDALYQISNKLAGAHDTDKVLDLIVNEATRLLGPTGALIRLLDGGNLVPAASTESTANFLAEARATRPAVGVEDGTNVVSHVMATKKPFVSEDIQQEKWLNTVARRIMQNHGFHGAATVPLVANDRSIGTLLVVDRRIRRFTEDEVSLLTAFADQASLALEKARLLNEAETEKERSDALYQISNRLAGAHDTDEVLDLIVNEASRLVGSPYIILRLLQGDVLVPRAATESAADYATGVIPVQKVEEGTSPAGHVMATKKPLLGEAVRQMNSPEARRRVQELGFYATASFPLVANDRSIGTLSVGDRHERNLTDDEVSLLAAFADQASLALEKARLLNEAETEKERSDALYQISNRLAGAHDTDEVLDLIVNEASRLVGSPYIVLRLLQGDVLVPRAATEPAAAYATGLIPQKVEEGISTPGHVMATKQPLLGEASRQMGTLETLGRLQEHGIYPTAIFPLLADNRSIGTLAVADWYERNLTDDEVSLLAAFADQASLALEKARYLQEAETREGQAAQLYEITTQLASSPDMDSVLDLITARGVDLFGCDAAAIMRYDQDKGGLVIAKQINVPAGLVENQLLRPGDGVAGQAFQQRHPVWSGDRLTDGAVIYSDPATKSAIEAAGPRAVLAVPVAIRGQLYGTLLIYYLEPHDFTQGQIQLLQTLADSAAVAIGNARFIDETQQAREDAEARERQTAQLYEVTAELASNHDLDSVLTLITQQAVDLMSSRAGMIMTFDEVRGGLGVSTMHGLEPDWANVFLRPGEGTSGRAFQERRVAWSDDFLNDPAVSISDAETNRLVADLVLNWGVLRNLTAPIMMRNEVYGILGLMYDKQRGFSEEDINLIQSLADSAAVAINNAKFIDETQQAKEDAEARERRTAQLYEVTAQLASNHDLDSVLDMITQQAVNLMGGRGGYIFMFDEGRGGPGCCHHVWS